MGLRLEYTKEILIADINNMLRYMNDFERYEVGDIETYTYYKKKRIPKLLSELNKVKYN